MKTERLKILENSLKKKENLFDSKLQNHFDTVKEANGQPLNDKRNGQATLNKWERQNNALRTLQSDIERTKKAIEIEEFKIWDVEKTKEILPKQILSLIENGNLIQWRKFPNFFFVKGVKKARIIWDTKKKEISCRYFNEITDQGERTFFAKTFNELRLELNAGNNN